MSDRLEEILTRHLQDIKAGHDGKLEQAIQSYIDSKIIEARIETANDFVNELVCRDDVLNEKAILHKILEYQAERISEIDPEPTDTFDTVGGSYM